MARLDQAQLALEAGVSLETIKRLERIRGAIGANVRTLTALIDALRRHHVCIEQQADGTLYLAAVGGASTPQPRLTRRTVRPEPSNLHRVIYFSRAAFDPEQAQGALDAIVSRSSERNADHGVGGALTYADGCFMQALEGGRQDVLGIYASILRDPRHRDLQILENRPVATRRFPNWVMCARAATKAEMARADQSQAGGFRPELLSPAAALGLLSWISELELTAIT